MKCDYKMCFSKRLYITEQEAQKILYIRQKRTDKTLRVYKCPICKGWHITHKERIENEA